MWKRIIIGIAALTVALTVNGAALPEQVQAASTLQAAYTGSNVNAQDYNSDRWSDVVRSALVKTADGQLMRFQADALSDSYLVEYYSSSYHLEKTVTVAKELSLFGAFYDDGTNYYVLSGQKNPSELDTVEVYRLTKYDHQWKRISSAGLYGANTSIPFNAGSARIASDGNLLFVRTSHEMYNGHQANVTIEFDTEKMKAVDSFTLVGNISYGYVSHSLNQFIRLDGGKIVGVDHGDGAPRSVVLTKYESDYSSTGFSKYCSSASMLDISGDFGANATGVSVGGFELSSGYYLVAGNAVSMGTNYSASGTRNIFVSSVDRNLSGTPVVHTITSYAEGDTSPSTPQFVKISDDSFLLLWMKDGVLNYCKIDGSGNMVGKIYTMNAELSDCVPIVANGKLVWYTWKNEADNFYEIDLTDLSKTNAYPRTNGHIVVTDEKVTATAAENGKSVKISCTGCGEVYLLQSWLIDANGKLTVSGTTDVERTNVWYPEWYSYREKIKTAVLTGTGMTDMEYLFYGCSNLTSVDFSGLDTSSVTNMRYMFYGCSSLTTLDLRGLDTGKVTDMSLMFEKCTSLKTLNLKVLDTGSVTDMGFMFYGCSSLTSLDLSGMNTGSLQYMSGMFENCSSLTSVKFSGIDTSKVISTGQMFENCTSLKTLDLSGLNTGNVTTMVEMFYGCTNLKTLNLSGFDNGKVKFMSGMFGKCKSLTKISSPKNVICDVSLPTAGEKESWQLSDGTVVTALPKNLSYSVLIERKSASTEDESTSDTEDTEDTGTTNPGTGTTGTTSLTTKNTTIKLAKSSYTYDGKAKKPAVTVYDSKGNKIESKYYSVTYKNNTKVGTATVTIKFKDKYTGTIKKTCKINPKATALKKVTSSKKKSVTVTWKKQAAQTTGYEIQCATNSKFTKNKKTVTVKGAKTTSKAITNLSAKTKYFVRIRTYKTVDGKKYYSKWSKALSVTVR